jgi:hypothetical protein
MAKQLVNQRKIYKINSSRFRLNKWDLTLKENNTHPQEIVSIGDNQVLEFIRLINSTTLENEENKINDIKKSLKFARKKSDKVKVKQLYKQLNDSIFIKDLCFVVIDKKDDYHKLNKKMKLNGVNFKRLLATTGGVKTSTIIYASERVHEELCRRIENEMLEAMRAEAKERNENLKKAAAERLRKNAEWNKANKPKRKE